MKQDFLNYLIKIKKYSTNTILNYELDIDKYETYLNSKKIKLYNVEYKDVLNFISYLKTDHKSTSINITLS